MLTVAVNPLVPAGYDVLWSVAGAVAIVLAIVALTSLSRAAKRLTAGQALIWVLVVLVLPVLGAATWLAIGRRATAERSAAVTPGRS